MHPRFSKKNVPYFFSNELIQDIQKNASIQSFKDA
jgi:hypothetical protein